MARIEAERQARQQAECDRAGRRAKAERRIRIDIAEAMHRCDHHDAVEDERVYLLCGYKVCELVGGEWVEIETED